MASPEDRRGPLVHRAVHHGAVLWLVAALQFVVAMAVVQLFWSGSAPYSLAHNVMSDLGNTGCAAWPHSTSPKVCSPWHDLFNGSVIVLGILVLLGVLLVRTAFPPRRSSTIGLALTAIGGLGSVGVGIFPENVDLTVHSISALVAFLLGNLGLMALGFAMFRDTRWDGYRAYTLFSGLIGLVATILFVTRVYLGLGQGGMERLIVAPLLLWLVVVSVHLLRIPQFAPRAVPTGR